MSTAVQLPHWDMSVVYPDLESPEFQRDFRETIEAIPCLAVVLDKYAIGPRESSALTDSDVEAFEAVIGAFESLERRLYTLSAYISSFVSTDSFDTTAQARQSELRQALVQLSQLNTRVTSWIGGLDVDALIERSSLARDHAFPLRKSQIEAEHLMPLPEENLASELAPSGGSAWSKLYNDVTSQLLVAVESEDGTRDLPMSVVRTMAFEPHRDVRRRGYEAELAAWRGVATPLSAALNSIKAETNALQMRRGWDSALEYAVFLTNIDRQTLDAMMGAARAAFPQFRRYLKAKARALDLPALTWYDLFAPLGEEERAWEYDEAHQFLVEQFRSYSPRLSEFADRAFRENWIDAEPRPGKRDGAFCMWLRNDESRVLSNYLPSFKSVSTLAHELGHAYHNFNLANRTLLQRQTPMTLAETASIFCETIIQHAALERAGRAEQIAILEAALSNATQVVVDISSRFLFEQRVFEQRLRRELSIDELSELMLDAQRETYGDGLDQSTLHRFMWAAKGHYYSTGRPYYNYPYMFGLLFGLGLYAQYQQDPDTFRAGYDDLLSSTGLADAATLAQRFGIDIRTPDFWAASLDIVRENVDRFEALIVPEQR